MTGNPLGGRYQVGDTLGFGGMSEVHRGRDLRLGRDVAIKVLRADLARDPSFQTRFRREAQNAASLNHPAIVAVYDTGDMPGETGPLPFIVMEYVDGETLRDLLKREGPLPTKRAMEVVADVCAALDFSHRHGIVHRDVKPANIMLTKAGAVKVMDFGIARAIADGQATVTATAAVIGTAQYLSPEQARGEAVDARSDVYATGCVLYELLTGTPPFTGDSPVAVAYQHVREDAKAPSEVRPGLGKELDAIVLKSLNKNPLNRYQTAAEMRSDLVRALSGQAVHATPLMTDDERTELMRAAPTRVVPMVAPVPLLAPPSILSARDDWQEEEDDNRAKKVWGFVGVGVLCLALLAGAIWFTLRITGAPAPIPPVAVPDVVNQTVPQATETLRQHNLLVAEQVQTAPSDDAHKGLVTSQFPSKGTSAAQGSTVTLTVGAGLAKVTVPNVQGMDAQQAKATLTAQQLKIEEKPTNSPSPQGRIFDQDPKPNVSVDPQSTVTVLISLGPEMVVVPNGIVGMPLPQATDVLTKAGLKVIPSQADSAAPKDQVIAMDQTPGAQVQKDTPVTLTVSNNSQMVVPNLANKSVADALAALRDPAVGWTGVDGALVQASKPTTNPGQWGKVMDQNPAAGATVTKSSTIAVTIGVEPTITVPDLTNQTVDQAKALLGSAGATGKLVIVTDPNSPPGQSGKIHAQDPAPSNVVKASTTITIRVWGAEPPPTSVSPPPSPTSAAPPVVPSTSG